MVLWAIRTSKRSSIGTTPYALTFGHEAILPIEIIVLWLRVIVPNLIIIDEYIELMFIELEGLK